MKPDPENLEAKLLKKLEKTYGVRGNTIVAFCLTALDFLNAAKR
jgi:hypothetical protein